MKRLKKILKWTGIVLGALVAIGLVANAWFVWSTDRRLERQLAAIRAAGEPLTLAELARKPIPPEQNAATYLRQAEADCAAIDRELWEVPDWRAYWAEPVYPMPPAVRRTIKSVLDAHTKAIRLLEQAGACPDYDPQMSYNLPPEEFGERFKRCRDCARVLRPQAELMVAEGRRDEAVRMALLLLRLARHFERIPTLSGYLVAATCDANAVDCANLAMQTGEVSRKVRDALDTELAAHEPLDGLIWGMKGDRAWYLDSLRTLPGRNYWLIGRPLWNLRVSRYLEAKNTCLAIMASPGLYRHDTQAIQEVHQESKANVVATHLLATRMRALIRSLRVLNAIQIHVRRGSNDMPKLAELGLPAETTTDPFTGEPLHVKRLPQGWLVYSVGPNLQDDGGTLIGSLGVTGDNWDVGVGPLRPADKPAEK
jgi:hypothetical protein